MEENKERQIEEIEALTSIYEHLFELENENKYTVRIEDKNMVANLTINLNADYPASSPPTYSLSAPFLSPTDKQKLMGNLETIYLENIGESIVFLWAEEIRQFIQNQDCDINPEIESVIAEQIGLENLQLAPESVVHSAVIKCPDIFTTDIFEDRKSVFQGHCAIVDDIHQINAVLSKLNENKKIAHATHNMHAYRIYIQEKNSWLQDCEDDGETAAGSRMLHLLEILDAKNVLVVVSRWYGGIHLGPDRFKHISNMTRRALEESGVLKQDKSSSKKKKK